MSLVLSGWIFTESRLYNFDLSEHEADFWSRWQTNVVLLAAYDFSVIRDVRFVVLGLRIVWQHEYLVVSITNSFQV